MGRKIIGYMWHCCLCRGYWNKSTTPACLDCGHQRSSCDLINPVFGDAFETFEAKAAGDTRSRPVGVSLWSPSVGSSCEVQQPSVPSQPSSESRNAPKGDTDISVVFGGLHLSHNQTSTKVDTDSNLQEKQPRETPTNAEKLGEPATCDKSLEELHPLDEISSNIGGPSIFTPEDVVARFISAVLDKLSPNAHHHPKPDLVLHHLLDDIQAGLDDFFDAICEDNPSLQKHIIEIIRPFQLLIAQQIFEKTACPEDNLDLQHLPPHASHLKERNKTIPDRNDSSRTSINRTSISSPTLHVSPEAAPELRSPELHLKEKVESRDLCGAGHLLADILKTRSYQQFCLQIDCILSQYDCDKMDLIRRRTASNLRPSPLHLIHPTKHPGEYRATLNVDWELQDFLSKNYNKGAKQSIKKIVAITGTMETASLCSIGEYFAWQWPNLPTTLLDSIAHAIGQSSKILQKFSESSCIPFPALHVPFTNWKPYYVFFSGTHLHT